jgi:hypothetical protein
VFDNAHPTGVIMTVARSLTRWTAVGDHIEAMPGVTGCLLAIEVARRHARDSTGLQHGVDQIVHVHVDEIVSTRSDQ